MHAFSKFEIFIGILDTFSTLSEDGPDYRQHSGSALYVRSYQD